jgi:phage shock protein A
MQREPTSILKLAKELVECKNSALCHEKTIKELREKRNKLKKNIKGLETKLSEMELE